jgi:vacuolar-type H+-ATPase subunit H
MTMPTQTMNRATRAGSDVASEATDEARDVASTAADRSGQLVRTAKAETRDLAGTVRQRAGEVTEELVDQGRNVAGETRAQIEARASAATQQLASAFRDLGQQAQALAEGRPEDAPGLTDYVTRAADGLYGTADRLHSLADDVEQRGISGVLDDLQTFARRRPGAFLLGAAFVGFGVGRVVRSEKQRKSDEEDSGAYETYDDGSSYDRRQTALRRPQPALGARAVR